MIRFGHKHLPSCSQGMRPKPKPHTARCSTWFRKFWQAARHQNSGVRTGTGQRSFLADLRMAEIETCSFFLGVTAASIDIARAWTMVDVTVLFSLQFLANLCEAARSKMFVTSSFAGDVLGLGLACCSSAFGCMYIHCTCIYHHQCFKKINPSRRFPHHSSKERPSQVNATVMMTHPALQKASY